MRNLSVMEQKQVVGGNYIVKAYYNRGSIRGQEDLDKRRTFYDEDDAWDYYYYLIDTHGSYYHVLEPQYRRY